MKTKTICVYCVANKESPGSDANCSRCSAATYNSNQSFRTHFRQVLELDCLAARCKSSLNVITCNCHINSVADGEISLHLYTAVVLSRINYACSVYSPDRRSCLIKLEPIHNAVVLNVTAAFRTSPAQSLYLSLIHI